MNYQQCIFYLKYNKLLKMSLHSNIGLKIAILNNIFIDIKLQQLYNNLKTNNAQITYQIKIYHEQRLCRDTSEYTRKKHIILYYCLQAAHCIN